MVWGIVASETPDSDQEICDYTTAKTEIKKWSDDQLAKTIAAGQDPSLGNMRVMHQLQIGGKAVKIQYMDDAKQVWVGSEPANEEVWHLLKGGYLTAHSIGGKYLWKRKEGENTRYGPSLSEISYVDKGANPDASFSYVKADGTTELRKFASMGPEQKEILARLQKASVANLSDSDIERISKALTDSILSTSNEKIDRAIAERMRQKNDTKGGDQMSKQQIELCAKALGISVEDFTKQFIEPGAFNKAAKGLAALHGHLEKAMAHHGEIMAAHDKLGKMHDAHEAHLGKCMKSCKDVMGSDEKESEKALKALLAELVPAGSPAEMVLIGKTSDGVEVFRKKDSAEVKLEGLTKAEPVASGIKAEDMAKAIKDAVEASNAALRKEFDETLKKTLAPANGGTNGARLQLVDREGKVIEKADTTSTHNAMAVD